MTSNLTEPQKDRASGVLLGQAVGDALGVPYEFATRVQVGTAEMIGGGLGPYQPGEWSDDTQMAACIALVTADGGDLGTEAGLDSVATGFLQWRERGASDIGNLTRDVLDAVDAGPALARRMTAVSRSLAAADRAGTGALMRTGVVGLVSLPDREHGAEAAANLSLIHI